MIRQIDRQIFKLYFLDKKRKYEYGSGFCFVFILDIFEIMVGEGLY